MSFVQTIISFFLFAFERSQKRTTGGLLASRGTHAREFTMKFLSETQIFISISQFLYFISSLLKSSRNITKTENMRRAILRLAAAQTAAKGFARPRGFTPSFTKGAAIGIGFVAAAACGTTALCGPRKHAVRAWRTPV